MTCSTISVHPQLFGRAVSSISLLGHPQCWPVVRPREPDDAALLAERDSDVLAGAPADAGDDINLAFQVPHDVSPTFD